VHRIYELYRKMLRDIRVLKAQKDIYKNSTKWFLYVQKRNCSLEFKYFLNQL